MKNANEIRDALWQDRSRTPKSHAKIAPCPRLCPNSHDDNSPSFSVSDAPNGKVLFHCLAGRCSQMQAQEGLRELGLWGTTKEETDQAEDLKDINYLDQPPMSEWTYRNSEGFAYAVHGRWDTPTGKLIRWRLPQGTYREGLGDTLIKNMPLYGADLIAARPTEPVIFCEGERATDACRSQGLLAVTNGGGASQTSFGNSLEVLRGRDVELFADNDPPGRQLMSNIQDQLRTIAGSVKILKVGKELPYKGDAVQFFDELKGTVEELRNYAEPVVEYLEFDRIRISIPVELSKVKGTLSFLFENLQSQHGSLFGQMTIEPIESPIVTENIRLTRRFNLLSSSSVTAVGRELKNSFKELDWATLLPQAVALVTKAMFEGEKNEAIDLASAMDEQSQAWLVGGIIPMEANTIIFGNGSSLKSISLHSLALHVAMGYSWAGHSVSQEYQNVLVLDYENTANIWKRQQRRLLAGMPGTDNFPEGKIRYLPMRGVSLANQMERVLRMVRNHNIKFILIDSAALASGGDPIDTSIVTTYFNQLQRLNELGITTITIAHVTKNASLKDSPRETWQPFGSTFWHNSARATYYVEKTQATGRNDFYSVFFVNRKMNLSYPPENFYVDILFQDPEGYISVVKGDPIIDGN